jgi:hypothetical protein
MTKSYLQLVVKVMERREPKITIGVIGVKLGYDR